MQCKQLDQFSINLEATDELKSSGKYQKYLEWGIQNGVKMSNIIMPAAFGPLGIPGVAASADLPANKAIIAVPFTLIISQERVQASELNIIFNKYPELFDEEVTQDAEFNTLALYVYMEKTKGDKSFFAPYFDVVQSGNTLFEWTDEELIYIENPLIIEEFKSVRDEMQELWEEINKIIQVYSDILGQSKQENRSLFYWSYELVMTRCFGWSLKSTSLVPFADMLNHSNVAATHYVVHANIEQGKDLNNLELQQYAKQYRQKFQKIDLQLIGVENQDLDLIHNYQDYSLNMILKNKVFLKGQLRKDIESNIINADTSQQDKQSIINQINYNVLNQIPHFHIWDLGFATSSDSEDNDSGRQYKYFTYIFYKDEDMEELRDKQFDQLREKEKITLEGYLELATEYGQESIIQPNVSEQSNSTDTSSPINFQNHTPKVYSNNLLDSLSDKGTDQTQQNDFNVISGLNQSNEVFIPKAILKLNESKNIKQNLLKTFKKKNHQKNKKYVIYKDKKEPITIIGIPEQHLNHALVKQYLRGDQEFDDGVNLVNLMKQFEERKQQLVKEDDESDKKTDSSEESEWDWLSENDSEAYFAITTTEPFFNFFPQQLKNKKGRIGACILWQKNQQIFISMVRIRYRQQQIQFIQLQGIYIVEIYMYIYKYSYG